MDSDVVLQTPTWTKTKQEVANFRRLLLCSKCSHLMKDPVCLGMCEHLLCRSCAGSSVGDGCVVCHSPAWVKDIQINRQLSSIIELFCDLEKLVNPKEQEDSTKQEAPASNQKKNFKIWFSPRSRKIRCLVEKPADGTSPESKPPGETAATKTTNILKTYRSQKCNSSTRNKRQTKKSAPSRKKAHASVRAPKKQTMQKMSRLQAINQQWGISEGPAALKDQPCTERPRRSGKRVSFGSPAVSSDKPCAHLPQGTSNELSPGTVRGTGLGTISSDQAAQANTEIVDTLDQNSTLPTNECEAEDIAEKKVENEPSPSMKRPRLKESLSLDTTPKRPRTSPAKRRKSESCRVPSVLNSPPILSPAGSKATRSPRVELGDSPTSSLSSVSRKSPRLSSGSPAVMKRNHKGETPLHIAAIKGDAEAVKELLEQGADPNLKDNAGWTPLHEACNLGHLTVVEILVSKGALLNTPGYKNDSPLHDAVRNGHAAIVKLLLRLGASTNVLNLHGKKPADYAVSREMLEIFQEATEETPNANTNMSPTMNLSRSDETLVVILSSKLSQSEQQQLAKLGQLLGARMADTFTESVTHVVVPDGQTPTTFSTLLGLLVGCWVVKYKWVEACLQAGERVPEIHHEAGEGPQRSRINRCSLLPPLFDGCFFFLLGSFTSPAKEELTRAAAYHAPPGSDQALCTQYILYDTHNPHRPAVIRRGKVWSAPSSWIIECITAFRLLPVPEPHT
ncbi:hypothetical protein WMY93_002968 [Mugilogobius chulae]|uniref:BRCT domain-containing protein n=1 Tax=Mugilogobius chulae TaxID=88201 RepID=A0AAW0Q5Z8_9GOBI